MLAITHGYELTLPGTRRHHYVFTTHLLNDPFRFTLDEGTAACKRGVPPM